MATIYFRIWRSFTSGFGNNLTTEGLAPYYAIDFGKQKLTSEIFDNNPQHREIITKFNNADNQNAINSIRMPLAEVSKVKDTNQR